MDTNGSRYHLVLGEDDWLRRAQAEPAGGVAYHTDRQELTLRAEPFLFPERRGNRPPRMADRRGAARDAFGNVYSIDAGSRSVRVLSAGSGTSSLFWEPGVGGATTTTGAGAFGPVPPPAPARSLPLGGLAVTEDHYLAVGTLVPPGLLVFDLHAPAPPRQLLWPEEVGFEPFDLCARSGGGVFVLDRRNGRLWELDRRFLVVSRRPSTGGGPGPAEFVPAPETGARPSAPPPPWQAHRRITDEDAVRLGGDPVAIETAPAGRVLVLDANRGAPPSTVRLMAPGEATGPVASLQVDVPDVRDAAIDLVAHDMALVAADPPGRDGGELGTLHVADSTGDQVFAFSIRTVGDRLEARLSLAYLPMRLFGGKALVSSGAAVLYDFGDTWLPLVAQDRPRYATRATIGLPCPSPGEGSPPFSGGPTPAFDGRQPGTVWHRLLLDASVPPGTSVRVETRAGDEERELTTAPWQAEPALVYRRSDGSELPFPPSDTPGRPDTWEVLLQQARGRYLQLRLTLTGDGRTTPRLRALRVYYPRFSYLEQYLPGVYGEDPQSASFVDRFLANLEGLLTALEGRIAASQALFDPRSAPAEALDWLLGWFAVAADPTWTENRRRLFLAHAVDFFALRGTVAGIQLALRLALDPCDDEHLFDPASRSRASRIVERFRTLRTPAVVLGDPTGAAEPRQVPRSPRWDPAQGRDVLLDRWRSVSGEESAGFPRPDGSERWRVFLRVAVGIDPPGEVDPPVWTSFLASRYGRIQALDSAYGPTGGPHTSFAEVPFPDQPPPDGAALRDWYQFLAHVLPARRAAHRFTVLLPVSATGDEGRSPEERRAIAERVVRLQKPAQTTFDVTFFWSAFRVGEARLGEDTLVDRGSRDPRLRQPVVLGQEHVGESYLGGDPPPTAGHVHRDKLHR